MKDGYVDRFPPFELDREHVMHGPFSDAESPVHETRFSEFLGSLAFCATCHEYESPAGAKILSTFTEYSEGSYPQSDVVCQGCHMPLILGATVAPEIKAERRSQFINSHALYGGRDIGQLGRAVSVELVSVERASGSAQVEVVIQNQAAGHWLPTGMPSRRMVLEVSTRWADEVHSERTVFGREVVDADGRTLTSVAAMMLRGARIVRNTRLRPRQSRQLSFTLPVPHDQATQLVVRLSYESSETQEYPAVAEDIVRIERDL